MNEVPLLPSINAFLNATSACLLVLGYLYIKKWRLVTYHKYCMLCACGTSTLFLVFYLTYHAHHGSTRFQGVGGMRTLYFTILVSHTILAVLQIPMIYITVMRGLKGEIEKHISMARITLPIWLYVSITGVVIYWMLYRMPIIV